MPARSSAADILNGTAAALSLPAIQGEPVGSDDETTRLLVQLLQDCGDELVREHDWQHLLMKGSFSISSGEDRVDLLYALSRTESLTLWREDGTRLRGPLGPAEWEDLLNHKPSPLVDAYGAAWFRYADNQFWFYPAARQDFNVGYAYTTSNWVGDAGGVSPTRSTLSSGADTVHFDPLLMRRRLRVAWLEAKGFDSSSARAEYMRTLQQCKGQDTGGDVLRIGGRGWEDEWRRFRLPPSGWGV